MEKTRVKWLFYSVIFSVLTISRIQSSEILVIFPTTAQSHYRVVRPLIHGLLDRGHKILAITNFPDDERSNLSHINIAGFKPHSKFYSHENTIMKITTRLSDNVYKYAAILDHPQVSNLLQSGRKFDLVIVEYFTTTALFTPIATVVNAPIIGIAPMIVLPWTNEVMGQESIVMPYVSDVLNNSTTLESFGIRITNYLFWMFLNYPLSWILNSKIQEMNELHYGLRKKSIVQSMANLSMILINNYPGVFLSTPRVPGIVDVAGIHVEDEKPLSQEFKNFINNAHHGVILFSLGSVVSESLLAGDKLNNIMKTFSKLKQRIIMKFDPENYNGTRLSNVKMVKWFPQRDLLAHPKVLLFVSHAGMMSAIETIHCGKPMVAIPIFGDQPLVANILVEKQMAVTVEYEHLNGNQLFNAINEVLTENYRNNAKNLQQLYNDRPQSPLETAIYWTEYIIRNKNESHELLKSPKIHLNFYQANLLDVFATFCLPIIISLFIIVWTKNRLNKY